MAPLAGAEPGGDAVVGRNAKLAILALRFPRRAGQAAEYSGRGHTDQSQPVEPGIAGQKGGIKGVSIGDHSGRMA
jgi:hypothetical protein